MKGSHLPLWASQIFWSIRGLSRQAVVWPVCGQGVHGVEDDGGNAAGAPAVGAARMVQQGQEEGLSLTASGAGGHERGPWCMVAAAQALKGAGLVQVGGESGGRSRSEERRVGKECRSRWSPYH